MEELIGNVSAKRSLQRMLSQGCVGNALLFAGPDGVGKSLFAKELAGQLLGDRERVERGQHPDFHLFVPEGRAALHPIDSMRAFSHEVFLPPNEAPRKVFVIDEADRMVSVAQNALLKTLEEPTPDSLIVLISNRLEGLLPTIRSRCRCLHFESVAEPEVELFLKARGGDPTLAWLARGSLGQAAQLAEDGADLSRDLLLQLLQSAVYGELRNSLKCLGERLEALRKVDVRRLPRELSAQQRECLERRAEAEAHLRFLREGWRLLREFVMWFRDGFLHQSGADSFYHRDYPPLQERKLAALLPLAREVERAFEALERFVKPAAVFEALLLRYL